MEAEKAEEPVTAPGISDQEVHGVHNQEDSAAEKRKREDDGVEDESAKKTKAEENTTDKENDKEKDAAEIKLGPKTFGSSVEMFDYFYKLLHAWSPDLEINKYEELVLAGLIQRGHAEPEKKIGAGIKAFDVRYHPQWKSRCFFLVRSDGSSDDFSFRKCVDHILPLPDSMKVPAGKGGNAARGRGGGRGRGGRGRRGGH